MVIGVGLIVTLMPSLIRADADDAFEKSETSSLAVNSERHDVLTNESLETVLSPEPRSKQGEAANNHQATQNASGVTRGREQDFQFLPPNHTLLVSIARGTSPKRAIALRLTETARNQMRAGEYNKAVLNLETALGLEANPYIYFYLARVHNHLGHYQESLNFLEVAESWLTQQPEWEPELVALRTQIPGSGA